MVKKQGGGIVNISSERFSRGRSGPVVYDAMKGAAVPVTKPRAVEFVDYGMRLNAIAPGYIVTEMHSVRDRPSEMVSHIHPSTIERHGVSSEGRSILCRAT